MADMKVDKTLDIKGLMNPRPRMLTMSTLEHMEAGQLLKVITSDYSTRDSIPSLCETLGYHLVDVTEEGGTLSYIIRK